MLSKSIGFCRYTKAVFGWDTRRVEFRLVSAGMRWRSMSDQRDNSWQGYGIVEQFVVELVVDRGLRR